MKKFVIFSFLMMVIFTSCYNQLHLQLVLFYSDDNQIVTMQAVKYGEKVKEPKNPEKTGYTFNGWYTSSDFSKEFDFNTKILAETHIYAKFDINKYNIHFESNSETVIDDVIVDYGSLLERPEELEKECYLFDGWYTDQEFNKEYNFDAIVIQDLTLYAKWNDNHAYDDGVVTKEPTCTEDGTIVYTCNKCGEVKTEAIIPIRVTGIELDKTELNLLPGDSYEFTLQIQPENAQFKTVKWSVSDTSIVDIENGRITAKVNGSVIVTVTSDDQGKTAECKVVVCPIDEQMEISSSCSNVNINGYAFGCGVPVTFSNNSQYDVNIDKVEVYDGAKLVIYSTDQELLGSCVAGQSKGIELKTPYNHIMGATFTINYYFTFNGESYKITKEIVHNF